LQTNMMRRHQMGIVFEAIKLLLLLVSGLLTYQFLGRFMPSMWERIAALAMYELGLLAWHYIHHWKVETPKQHMFSKTLSLYSVRLSPDQRQITEVKNARRLETHFRSPQLDLWQLSDTEWLLALRRPEPVARKKPGNIVLLARQLPLPGFGATG
jgi:hypothetical protein